MVDITTLKTRQAQQDRVTDHRDGVIDSRRNTRAPEFQGSATMRTAQRGDAGAEELMRTLGMVNGAAKGFQAYADTKFAKDEQRNAAQGTTDELTGHVDEELMRKSAGYKNAVSLGRTSTSWNEGYRQFDQDMRAFIEQQDDENLEVRLGQVQSKIDEFYKNFAIDPDTGKLKDFLSTPGAMRYLSEQMRNSRAQVTAAARQKIEERFNVEAVGHYAQNLRDQFQAGGGIDLKAAMSLVPGTVPKETLRKATLDTVTSLAVELEAKTKDDPNNAVNAIRLLDQLTGVKEGIAKGTIIRVDIPPSSSASDAPKATSAAVAAAKPVRLAFDTLASAVKHVESGGDHNAVSPKGAVGSMQTMPFTLADPGFGVKPAQDDSPAERERVGRDYLRAMLKRYGGSYVKALAAYNAGPGKVDEWIGRFGKVTDTEFARLIPFEETRSYVGKVLGRAGVKGYEGASAPGDAVAANPDFKMDDEPLDPVAEAERTPGLALFPQMTGEMALRPEERTKLIETRSLMANRIRADWERKRRDDQDEAGGAMLMRLNGQGAPVTSQEVAEMARKRLIRPEQAQGMFNLLRQNSNDAESEQDRAIARSDRETARRQESETDTIVGSYLGSIVSGRESPQAARTRLLAEASKIADPKVRRNVIDQVGSFANSYESLRNNSAPVREAMGKLDELEVRQRDLLAKSALGGRRQAIASQWAAQVDVARSRFARRVLNGEDASKVYEDERKRLAGFYAQITARPSAAGTTTNHSGASATAAPAIAPPR